MGFWGNVGTRVRGLLQYDKERVALALAKGDTGSTYPQSGLDVLQSYGYDILSDYLKLEQDLMSRYVDVESMDDYPELSAALNIYSQDATQTEPLQNRSIWVDSSDKTVEEMLTDLFDNRLRIDEEIESMARMLAKYGNLFEELLVTNDGLVGISHLPAPTMRRIEGRRGEVFGFVQDFKGRFGYSPDEFKQLLGQRAGNHSGLPNDKLTALEDWEVVHMRLRSKQRRSAYGVSVLDSSRWIWKRLMLLEDSAMVYRLERAAERYVYYVDVGDKPPRETFAYLNKIRQQHKKTKFYNQQTGTVDLKFNPLGQMEDIFIPTRGGQSSSKVEVLSSPNWQAMHDIDYFRSKLFASIMIPKTYLGFNEATGKTTLSSQDVRFARAVLGLQRELRNGLKKMARVHMAALNVNPDRVEHEIYMTVPSSIFELAQLEVRNAKADFAGRMSQFVSLHWILQRVFGLSDEEIEYIIKQRHQEQMADAEIQAKAMGLQQAATAPPQPPVAGQPAPANGQSEAQQRLNQISNMSRMWPQRRQQLGYRPISEQELLAGNRDHEKRLEDNMEKMLKKNDEMSNNLTELGGFINDLRQSIPKNRRGV